MGNEDGVQFLHSYFHESPTMLRYFFIFCAVLFLKLNVKLPKHASSLGHNDIFWLEPVLVGRSGSGSSLDKKKK